MGTSVTVKVGDINEKIMKGKSRRTRKELVFLYYLAHIDYVLLLYHFWWLVPILSMVYRCWTPVEVYSETPIHILTILLHLSVSPPSSWRLMMVCPILNSTLSVDLGLGILPSLRNKYSAFLPSWWRVISSQLSTIRPELWPLPSSFGYIKALRMHSHYSSIISPYQENTAAYSSRIMAATVWSWVDNILQEHQRRSLLRDLEVSINTAVWMVMWRDPAIQEQPDITNICYIYLLAPIVNKIHVHICTSW